MTTIINSHPAQPQIQHYTMAYGKGGKQWIVIAFCSDILCCVARAEKITKIKWPKRNKERNRERIKWIYNTREAQTTRDNDGQKRTTNGCYIATVLYVRKVLREAGASAAATEAHRNNEHENVFLSGHLSIAIDCFPLLCCVCVCVWGLWDMRMVEPCNAAVPEPVDLQWLLDLHLDMRRAILSSLRNSDSYFILLTLPVEIARAKHACICIHFGCAFDAHEQLELCCVWINDHHVCAPHMREPEVLLMTVTLTRQWTLDTWTVTVRTRTAESCSIEG